MWFVFWIKAWLSSPPTDSKGKKAAKASAKGAGLVALIAGATSVIQKDIERRDAAANEKMNRIESRAIEAVHGLTKLVDEREDQRKTDTKELKETTKRIEAWVYTLTQEFREQRSGGRRPDSTSEVTPVPMTGQWQIADRAIRAADPKEN